MDLDTVLTQSLNSLSGHSGVVDFLTKIITHVGIYLLVATIALRWFLGRNQRADRHLVLQCGMAAGLGLMLNQIILLLVHRSRPYEMGLTRLLIDKSSDPSFPSDHATLVTAIATLLIIRRDRWAASVSVFGFLICLSRVYVGTHFVSDVIGGSLIGILGAFGIARYYRLLDGVTEKLVRLPKPTRV